MPSDIYQVIEAIETEIQFQEAGVSTTRTDDPCLTVGEYLLLIDMAVWSNQHTLWSDMIRRIAALACRCLMTHDPRIDGRKALYTYAVNYNWDEGTAKDFERNTMVKSINLIRTLMGNAKMLWVDKIVNESVLEFVMQTLSGCIKAMMIIGAEPRRGL